jgi:hypothetical protein
MWLFLQNWLIIPKYRAGSFLFSLPAPYGAGACLSGKKKYTGKPVQQLREVIYRKKYSLT